MAIEIKFNNNYVAGGKAVLTTSSDSDVKFSGEGNQIHDVERVFHIYDRSEIVALGLVDDTPPGEVEQVVDQLKAMPDASEAEKAEVVSNSRLKDYLAHGSSITTIAKNVIDIALKLTGNR